MTQCATTKHESLARVEHIAAHTGNFVRGHIVRMSVAGIEGYAVLLGTNTHIHTLK
jgi:hypothetical protein